MVGTKKPKTSLSDKKDGVGQLKSSMAACLNARYGLWTNGDDRFCLAKRASSSGAFAFEETIEVPVAGQFEEEAQRPRRKDLKPATDIAGTEGMQTPGLIPNLMVDCVYIRDG